jgi:hypothetical protein
MGLLPRRFGASITQSPAKCQAFRALQTRQLMLLLKNVAAVERKAPVNAILAREKRAEGLPQGGLPQVQREVKGNE